jgi:branched-chain amino acid transport system substrate-binding protein
MNTSTKKMRFFLITTLTLLLALGILRGPAWAGEQGKKPVIIGFDAEAGHMTSTSDDAIQMGILTAIHEINAAGGVLGGRPLELLIKDNRSVPARGIKNIEEFAKIPDLVAVVGGKFSPVLLEEVPVIHQEKVILLDAWAAADTIVDNGKNPNFCFRLSLKDSWGIQTMMDFAFKKGAKRSQSCCRLRVGAGAMKRPSSSTWRPTRK